MLHKRLKHPQYGYTGLVSGKIRSGEGILKTATREFVEETNLSGDFKIIGNLCEKNEEGECFWVDLDRVGKLEKIFKPSL